ncbi:hypothetical protein [Candidatus Kuenenia stuttgartiensis]|uniref:hypothetical protein n=1 Tax=Kuenenia stuttgartiensis TaxID=174633 RepID=UPI00146CC945|nr:hypothetical protein [Candidatus Kuenenia stuttgartiensis]
MEITERRIDELCSNLWDFDFDNRARTLKTIADLGTHIRSCRRHLDSLIFPVVENIFKYFRPWATYIQGELFSHGQHYPPRVEYLELLHTALEALVGPLMNPDEAIMDVVYFGTTASRIRAIEWLADHRLTAATHDLFSDYLRMTLLSTAQRTPLFIALKYADAEINDHVDEAIYFFIDKIILGDVPDELKAKAREYLVDLHEEASQAALIHAFAALAGSINAKDMECASELFDEVVIRDLDDYSDNTLELICCFRGWPSDEQDEVDEREERVIEELKRRGLHG